MKIRELIIELLNYPLDAEVELAEEGSLSLSSDTMDLDTAPNGYKILWLGSTKRVQPPLPNIIDVANETTENLKAFYRQAICMADSPSVLEFRRKVDKELFLREAKETWNGPIPNALNKE